MSGMSRITPAAVAAGLIGKPQSKADVPAWRDMSLTKAERMAAFSQRMIDSQRGLKPKSADKAVNCEFCQDRRFILCDSDWINFERIPRTTEDESGKLYHLDVSKYTQYDPNRGGMRSPGVEERMVPCDCHPGLMTTGQDAKGQPITKEIRRFAEVFGRHISSHWFGQALVEARRNRYQNSIPVDEKTAREMLLFAGPQPGDEVPDPPEHSFDLENYTPDIEDPDTIARRAAELARIEAMAKAEGVEIKNLLSDSE